MRNGYATMHNLSIQAPADMLETTAGFQNEPRTRAELWWALKSADADNVDSLRWAACVIERRLDELSIRP